MFRFTIRELIILTLCVALGMGWLQQWRASSATARKNVMLRHALQSLMNEHQRKTGENLGVQLPDGEFLHSREPEGVLIGGSS